jgi:ribosome-associated protein
MDTQKLVDFIVDKLEDIKAQDIVALDVHDQTDVTDYMIIASGTSTQHVRAIAQKRVARSQNQSSLHPGFRR